MCGGMSVEPGTLETDQEEKKKMAIAGGCITKSQHFGLVLQLI